MQYPKFIQLGSTIGVPAPSAGGYMKHLRIVWIKQKKYFLSQGYHLVISNNLFKCKNGRSSSAENRAREMNAMFSS